MLRWNFKKKIWPFKIWVSAGWQPVTDSLLKERKHFQVEGFHMTSTYRIITTYSSAIRSVWSALCTCSCSKSSLFPQCCICVFVREEFPSVETAYWSSYSYLSRFSALCAFSLAVSSDHFHSEEPKPRNLYLDSLVKTWKQSSSVITSRWHTVITRGFTHWYQWEIWSNLSRD